MTRRIVSLLVLPLLAVFLVSPVLAGDACEENINTVCIGCHNSDRVCDNLGASAKTWNDILEWMISNGAELEDDEVAALVKCFSEPSAGVKKVCGK